MIRILKQTAFRVLILLFLLITLNSCDFQTKKPSTTTFLGMGTFFKISVYDLNFDRTVFQECISRVRELELLGNPLNPMSEINNINEKAIHNWAPISKELLLIIRKAYKASQITNGAFDITIKPLIDYFEIKKEKIKTKKTTTINPKDLFAKIGYENIRLKNDEQKILLKNSAQLDLSGVLKGYAVDEIVAILKKAGVNKAIVNGGGNIFCIGTDINDKAWVIGLKDPNNPKKIIKKVSLSNQAVATSAGYERYIHINNKKYSHIIDPRTGKLVPADGAVSVVADKAIWADILSTAAFVNKNIRQKIVSANYYFF